MQSDNEFCRLIEYNMKNSFLEKSYTKSGGQTIPRPFFEKSKLKICLDQKSKVVCSLLVLYVKLRAIEIY